MERTAMVSKDAAITSQSTSGEGIIPERTSEEGIVSERTFEEAIVLWGIPEEVIGGVDASGSLLKSASKNQFGKSV